MDSKLQKLKQWRDELAQRSGKPAYYILTNKNLEDAFRLKPEIPQELESLSGWGPKKVEKYGQEVLKMIDSDKETPENNPIENSRNDESILSVAQYINFINLTVQQFNEIKVIGEISDLSGTERGLAFFDLKDANDHESTMQCVVFRNNFVYLSHLLEEGLGVKVYGLPSIYPKNGNFKFVITRIEPIGEGGYKKILEKLRKKLLEKGYFNEERKRVLPTVIKKIGLITSGNGAAIHDFQRNLADFGFDVFLKNVYVEGDQAENSITEAIKFFNQQTQKFDVLVIIRGGGSWESLKAFNSERVVETVISSKIPTITGIGHENDETFVGMSSDFNCSTPSIVATQISQTREEILDNCNELSNNLQDSQENFLNNYQSKTVNYLNLLSSNMEKVFNNFNQSVKQFFFLLNEKIFQTSTLIQKAENFKNKITQEINLNLNEKIQLINLAKTKINFLNPKNILKKGYGVIYSAGGKIIDSIKKIKNKELIRVELKDGNFKAKIEKIETKN
jgi:exodeoxyribonuclease VII large subunit